jgi:hypothetical protein
MRKPPKAVHSNALFIRNKYVKSNNNDFYIAAYYVKHRPGFRRCHLFHINLGTVGADIYVLGSENKVRNWPSAIFGDEKIKIHFFISRETRLTLQKSL